MKKSIPISNKFCPQSLFLYGTYREDGKPNFGLFGWFSYYWDTELGVMACIGGDKLTRDRIRDKKVFSANLVTEDILPIADYFGNKEGYNNDKMNIPFESEKGQVLDVPIFSKSPWVFELEVSQSITAGYSEIYLCKIKNVLADEFLCNENVSLEQQVKTIKPVRTISQSYYAWSGDEICAWGKAMKE